MTEAEERIGQALRVLRSRGFSPVARQRGAHRFEGSLPCAGQPVRIRLSISDWDFLSYPAIEVLTGIDDLPRLLPHLSRERWLCYFAEGSVVLDRFNPAQALLQCLNAADEVLTRIRKDPAYRSADVQDEFVTHWLLGQSKAIWPVLIGTVGPKAVSAQYWKLDIRGRPHALISDNNDEVSGLAKAFGSPIPNGAKCPCWILRASSRPPVPPDMPSTISAMFAWLKSWDRKLFNQMQRVLEKEKLYLQNTFASFAIDTPIGWLGFAFDLDPVRRLGSQKRPSLYKQYLHGSGGATKLYRLAIKDLSPGFVHSRNLSYPDLSGKKIVLVGCGAIGSYLAQGLVRMGAGRTKGLLRLIDPGILEPENLGRHSLGFPDLFRPKVEALREELVRQFPHANIKAEPVGAQDVRTLFSADLLIDATGDEAVSEYINGIRLEKNSNTPVQHVWIMGNGEVVQALWTQARVKGCYRCLRQANHKNYRQERFPVLKGETERRHLGCTSFTPYAVSAPMHASSLALDMIVDWLEKGEPHPRFRTRSAENANSYAVKNQDITRVSGCPACGDSHAPEESI